MTYQTKNIPIKSPNYWPAKLDGLFIAKNDDIHFWFQNTGEVLCFKWNSNKVVSNNVPCVSLPQNWHVITRNNTTYLCCPYGENMEKHIVFDTTTCMACEDASILSPPYFKDLSQPTFPRCFEFGEYRITQSKECTYICYYRNRFLWNFCAKGYLYTDMYCWKDRLYFGTGGQGGYFYLLDIQTGQVLQAIRTLGTNHFAQNDGKCYVLGNKKNAVLYEISLENASILSETPIKGTATIKSALQLINGEIHCITYKLSNHNVSEAYWNRIVKTEDRLTIKSQDPN